MQFPISNFLSLTASKPAAGIAKIHAYLLATLPKSDE